VVRIAVSLDDGPLQVLDYATIGRSDEWRNNVLSNTAVRTIPLKMLYPGRHELKVYVIDSGAMIDHRSRSRRRDETLRRARRKLTITELRCMRPQQYD